MSFSLSLIKIIIEQLVISEFSEGVIHCKVSEMIKRMDNKWNKGQSRESREIFN